MHHQRNVWSGNIGSSVAVLSFSRKASLLACGEVTLKKDWRFFCTERMVGCGGDSFSRMNK